MVCEKRQAWHACALALAVMAGLPREGESGKEEEIFHCCSPPTWTVRTVSTAASVDHNVNKYSQTTQTYHYDSVNQREAFTDMVVDGQSASDLRIVLDYKQHVGAFISGDMCWGQTLPGDFKPACTPDDYTANQTIVQFAVAPTLSPVDGVFANTVHYGREGVTGHLTVTVGNCALIESAEFTYGTPQVNSVKTALYFNTTLTVQPDVFKIPESCVSVAPGDADFSHVMETLNRVADFSAALVG